MEKGSLVLVKTRRHYLFGIIRSNFGENFEVEILSNGDRRGDYKGVRRNCSKDELRFLRTSREGEEITTDDFLETVFNMLEQFSDEESLHPLMAT